MDELKEEKKEIQETIIPQKTVNEKVSDEELFNTLKLVSPGTSLRTALDGILKMNKGALIAVENEHLNNIIDGGFKVNCKFTPQKMMELTKMDGAIILSRDMKRIVSANVLLTPESRIKSSETGTRHKAAERTAKQVSGLVVAISERKNEITIFYKNAKYILKDTDIILRKTLGEIQVLEKQRELFDSYVSKLDRSEIRNYHSLQHAVKVIQKGKLIEKISKDIRRNIIELGVEGTLLRTRLKEITTGVEKETNLVLKDYTKLDTKKSRVLLDSLSYEDILDSNNILRILAYEDNPSPLQLKGWRILSKTSLSEPEIAKLIKESGSLGKILYSNVRTYTDIIGEEKAPLLKEEIERMKLNT